ncbi:MAG: PhnD/SsuA/transferrin family substrate-binding protein [Oscillatoria princeps RMCB-10]|jgi:serine/threonine-protein kinase|nr:PhnD/SsuA/transferrin family substrate-binding protein [Oscillatoria princeps RMCB-10]
MNVITCANCGKENPVENLFCSDCGSSLAGLTPSQASLEPQPAASTELQAGARLRDRYIIERLLAQGGFGRTYRAEDTGRFNAKVAIKELSPGLQGTYALQRAEELFKREAQTLNKLAHPQIPKFWEIFREGTRLFLVQDFVGGQTYYALLQERLELGQSFSEAEILQLFRQLLPVLSYLHGQGVIHRDISPDNIILRSADSLPVVIDLGAVKEVAINVATQIAGSPAPGTCVGKVGYAPDEQLRMGIVAPHSDLYALAVTGLVLLTGKKDPRQLLDPNTLQWVWDKEIDLSPKLAEALNRMLAPKPAQRFQSAVEVLHFLEEQLPTAPPPPFYAPAPDVPVPPRQLWPLAGAGLAAAAVALSLFLLNLKNQGQSGEPNREGAFGGDGTLNIGVVTTPRNPKENYLPLADYLKSELGAKLGEEVNVEIEGIEVREKDSLKDAKDRIIEKKWDVIFPLSAQLSVAAQDNSYVFAARMFPKQPQIESVLFVRSDSQIQGLNDLTPDKRIALGEFSNTLSFYMPVYDLYGKIIRVDMGNAIADIVKKVKSRQAEVGVSIYRFLQNDPDVRVIGISKSIPGPGVYLSPALSPKERNLVKTVLLHAPSEIQEKAYYGEGKEVDYTQFRKIMARVEGILACVDLNQDPVSFFCRSSADKSATQPGEIQGPASNIKLPDANTIHLTVQGQDGQAYRVVLPRAVLNQIPSAPLPFALKGKTVKVTGVEPRQVAGTLELEITKPEQLTVR